MIKYDIVVFCYGKVLLNVAAYVIPGCVYVVYWSAVHSGSYLLLTITPHTHNQELHMQPHLPRFYRNNKQLYYILSLNNSSLQLTQTVNSLKMVY